MRRSHASWRTMSECLILAWTDPWRSGGNKNLESIGLGTGLKRSWSLHFSFWQALPNPHCLYFQPRCPEEDLVSKQRGWNAIMPNCSLQNTMIIHDQGTSRDYSCQWCRKLDPCPCTAWGTPPNSGPSAFSPSLRHEMGWTPRPSLFAIVKCSNYSSSTSKTCQEFMLAVIWIKEYDLCDESILCQGE